jgi:deoxyribodipyrimidine photo-lyase
LQSNIPDVLRSLEEKQNATIRAVFENQSITSPEIPELALPTLEELGLSFTPIDPRAAIQFKEEKQRH